MVRHERQGNQAAFHELAEPPGTADKINSSQALSNSYPIYDVDFQSQVELVGKWLIWLVAMMAFDRPRLYVHENKHRAFAMAYCPLDRIVGTGSGNREKWLRFREHFAPHIVED